MSTWLVIIYNTNSANGDKKTLHVEIRVQNVVPVSPTDIRKCPSPEISTQN